ncbi:PLC-like phosphodiesterase [Decorospora gaudefroyi]|uniref:PLC-like phosphodiesterase n=1 Tax=Decorospora gaudefroyi TaxID=184978 RepID=A0A6A5K798_9PLEO|nr:PLC-like phosphodiesterase [Decorospora gaudefroyi]
MPSKGVKCFAYIAVNGVEIEYTVPKQSIKRREQHQFITNHVEVESSNLPKFKFTGRFEFIVRRDGRELAKQWVDINSMTGKLEDGTMMNMDQTPSIFAEDLIIVYGFYDAGPGLAKLPKQHQCYITVTRNYANWMHEVIPQDSEKSNRPFYKMVLPSPHDIGMNNMSSSLSLLKNAGTGIIKEVFGRSVPNALSIINQVGDKAINRIAPDVVRALAITQKDTLDTILQIGARYFEFRPAKCHRQMQKMSPLEDTWYFQHGAIPGMPYRTLLTHIVQFLQHHREEVIVVHNRWDGVPSDCPRPNDQELKDVLNDVLRNKDLCVGNQDDMMRKSIRALRSEKKRLIVLKDTAQISNYDDDANATLTGDSMVDKLHTMSRDPPKGHHPITLLQCQATATNIRDVIVASVLNSDVSTSPILATKPVCDHKMLPLLRGEVGKKLVAEESVVVVLNDFFDGATADVAINLCRDRLG